MLNVINEYAERKGETFTTKSIKNSHLISWIESSIPQTVAT